MTGTYLVGGAVRDKLLGRDVSDYDYVVVGATPQMLLSAGFKQVGSDFPVFLNPITNDEYALARTERSTGSGYGDFTVDFGEHVTLNEDLYRRDLTINAIAEDSAGGIVDPYGGISDLKDKVLRHVSEAFKDDPVRVLRVARFAAQLGFTVHNTTMTLMRDMVADGMLEHLTSERVFKELEKALSSDYPWVFFGILRHCDALEVVFPEIYALMGQTQPEQHHPEGDSYMHTLLVLEQACLLSGENDVRYAALVHDLGKGVTAKEDLPRHIGHEEAGVPLVEAISDRLKVPKAWKELGVIVSRYHLLFHRWGELSPRKMVKWWNSCDAYRRPDRFHKFLLACLADANRRGETKEKVPLSKVDYIMRAMLYSKDVDMKIILDKHTDGGKIASEIHQQRVSRLKFFLKNEVM